MKKTIKILISVLLLTLLSATLVGCKQLDDLKKKHGVFLDATKEEIELRGHVYEKVMERVMYGNAEDESYLIADEWSMNVTDKEVPLLLAESSGQTARYNSREEDDPVILSLYESTEHSQMEVFYCREDQLETLKAKMNNVKLDHFYYTKMMYSEEENKVVYKKKLVSEKATEVINKTLARPYDPAMDLAAADVYYEYSEFKDLRYTDADLFFTNDINLEICQMSTGEYYIYGSYSKEFPQTDEMYWKKVAAEDKALLDELFFPDYVETFSPEEVQH